MAPDKMAPDEMAAGQQRHCVLMVCDFFWPALGGVEMHIWSLSQCLLRLGHKVVVLTHATGDRHGVRHMTNGLKVYYVPWIPVFQECTFPTFFPQMPLLREIVLREGVEIVHGHQDSSAMVHEALFHAQTLGLRTCFTSHSLFNIYDSASLHLNKVLRLALSGVGHCITVSNTCRESIALRCGVPEARVSTIPNAVDPESFTPDPTLRDPAPRINIVVISRLAYRKGTDLVAQVIPLVCRRFPNVHFVVGGDGPKRLLLDEMRERHQLHDRVELLGRVPHTEVRSVLCRGTLFLNCSLTEAFCMAILEAASCGLYVVSTRVGGIPEVLPPDMISYASEPSARAVARAIVEAIEEGRAEGTDPHAAHERIKSMYDWAEVARRVADVYSAVKEESPQSLEARLWRCKRDVGTLSGVMAMFLVVVDTILLYMVALWRPAASVERAPSVPLNTCLRSR